MKKKLQVFVSSTYFDLQVERQAAVEQILNSGHIPAGMELFAAGDQSQVDTIKKWIDGSDVFMLILGGRYGSLDPVSKLSYTELEYDYAVAKGKKLFAVVMKDKALDRKLKSLGRQAIEMEYPQQLKHFREKVLKRMSAFFSDSKDLKLAISKSLGDLSENQELSGWVRSDHSRSPIVPYDEFYEGFQKAIGANSRVNTLDIFALSTSRFVRQVSDRPNLKINRVRVVLPSSRAVDTFYQRSKGALVRSPDKAAQSIKTQIKENVGLWQDMNRVGKIKRFEVLYVDTFPLFYVGLLDRRTCLGGYFETTNKELLNGIAMGPTWVLEREERLVRLNVAWFDAVWRVGGKKTF